MHAFLSSIEGTVVGIWNAFIADIPFFIAGLVVVFLTWLAAMLFSRSSGRLLHHWRLRGSLQQLVTRLATIGIWIVGLLVAAMIVFPDLTPTKALGGLGLVSIAIGFAFKDIFENFFAGILILWRFPFENGDFVECEGVMGRVENVTIRMTQIRRVTGELVVVPNSFLFKNAVDVLTNQPKRRTSIIAGVAYGEDVATAVEVIRKAVLGCASVDDRRKPEVFPQAFGESSIDIEVAWWTDPTPLDIRRSRGEVVTAVKAALDAAGIEIPFPYRTLTFKEPLELHDGARRPTEAREEAERRRSTRAR